MQAIEEEGGDPDNIELTVSTDTPNKKPTKGKGCYELRTYFKIYFGYITCLCSCATCPVYIVLLFAISLWHSAFLGQGR